MPSTRAALAVLLLTLHVSPVPAAEVEPPPRDNEPVLRIDPGAPSAFVTALAFSPDGRTLYAGGWDKVIRVWSLTDKGCFERSRVTYRVPVGPGLLGAINTLALSPDGNWLAAAGNGTARQLAGFRELGFLVPSYGVRDPIMRRDLGTIYLFSTRDQSVRMLRGHEGAVRSLTFGPTREKGMPRLLSLAEDEKGADASANELIARLWDVERGESLAELKGLPMKALAGRRPDMALWQSGSGADDLTAALALYDGRLRLWEPMKKQAEPRLLEDLPHNLNLAYFAGPRRLLTAGYDMRQRQAKLTRWQVPTEGEPEAARHSAGDGLVRGLAAVSRQGDGVADLAALLVIQFGAPHQYRLRLVEPGNRQTGRIEAEVPLWQEKDILQLTVATALRGKHLAVAGNQQHDIRIYPVASLLRNEDVAPQIVRADVRTFEHASFVRRGKDLGLLLNPKPRKAPGAAPPEPDEKQRDWIFDIGKRRLTDTLAGWQAARPKAGAWRAEYDGARTLTVREGEKAIRTISLPGEELLTEFALLPPDVIAPVPLLALATHRGGQPRLAIYEARSGKQLREYTGHRERLRSLAFSPDGRLLVSSAVDGTVCVWSLTDLDTIRGRHGRLPGVILAQTGETATVHSIANGNSAQGKLRQGDVLAGLVEKGKLRRLTSPRAFYEAFYERKPGAAVVVRRVRGGDEEDVTLVAGQGIDERKPLFSLFVNQAEKAADSEWIGWSPLGPYDASSPRAEKYLGWHFNTGEARAPTRYAGADQYRKFYYREGILKRLTDRGNLGRGEAIQLPPPVIGAWIEERGQILQGPAPILVRRPQVHLRATVLERPLSSLSSLSWQLDGGAAKPLALEQPEDSSFDVPMELSRGVHHLVISARTREDPSHPVRESLTVTYRPLPPEVVLGDAGRQVFVRAADFSLAADIKPQVEDEEIAVTLRHRHEEGEEKPVKRIFTVREVREGGRLSFVKKLKLRPGNNVIEVLATNGGAGGDEREMSRQTREVFYVFKAKPPTIRFGRIVPLAGRGEETPLEVDASRPLLVRRPVLRLEGALEAGDESLTEAVWDRGKGTKSTRLAGFEPGKRVAAFRERIVLEPGVQVIRIRARTKNSDEAARSLTLEYRPPIPQVRLTSPGTESIFDGQDETRTISVRGKLVSPSAEARGYKVVLLLNGKPVSQAPSVDQKAGTVEGSVSVGPGESRLQIQVSNPWGALGTSEEAVVRFVRPPVIQTFKHDPVPGRGLVNLAAEVLSSTPLERGLVKVSVNDREASAGEIQIQRGANKVWTVRLQGVSLDAGSREQRISLRVSNREAECRRPEVLVVQSAKVLPPPEVDFLEPRQNLAVSTPRMTIRFQVRSEGKLERVHLQQQGQPDQPIDVTTARREGERSELTVTREVELQPGLNVLSVAAVSVSGRRPDSPQLVLNYVPPPLRIAIRHLSEAREGAAPVPPSGKDLRGLVFPPAVSGRVWLHGDIHWADSKADEGRESFLLRVFVNGFQQFPVYVRRKVGAGEKTTFRVPVLLNRARENHLRLVASPRDLASTVECTVDCRAPITRQRLYVLALSAHARSDELEERIRGAIHTCRADRREPASAFAEIHVQPPMTGYLVSPHFLCTRLAVLETRMRQRQRTTADSTPMNDVLMIYYEGGETINEEGHFFETLAGAEKGDPLGMPCDKLVNYLSSVPGAHVLMLDVERSLQAAEDLSRDRIKSWERNYADTLGHVVVMRCARRGAANNEGAVRLLPVLQQTIPRAERLSKLVALVEEMIAASNEAALLVFKSYVPTELADLMLGSPP